jgi:ketosteroid isomerase-like protein
VIAAGASRDLAYLVALEHTTVSVSGSPPLPYTLRATTVFRREDDEWKVVHRHADPVASDNAAELLQRLVATEP